MRARLFSGLTVSNAGGGWSRFALMAGLVGSLVGCATPVQVQSDFDVSADFSRYQTFNFISDNPLLVATVEPVSPLARCPRTGRTPRHSSMRWSLPYLLNSHRLNRIAHDA